MYKRQENTDANYLSGEGIIEYDWSKKNDGTRLLRAYSVSYTHLDVYKRQLLNTTQKDFDLFWGRIYGNGTLYVDGPVSALNISTPEMKALNNSVFTFNSNSTSNVEEFKMLRFLKRDDAGIITVEDKKKSSANMNLSLIHI